MNSKHYLNNKQHFLINEIYYLYSVIVAYIMYLKWDLRLLVVQLRITYKFIFRVTLKIINYYCTQLLFIRVFSAIFTYSLVPKVDGESFV